MRALKKSFAAITSLLFLTLVISGFVVPNTPLVVFIDDVPSTGAVEAIVACPADVSNVLSSIEGSVSYVDESVPSVYLCSVEAIVLVPTAIPYSAPHHYNDPYFAVV